MQIAAETTKSKAPPGATLSEFSVAVQQSQFSPYRVIRRNGALASFDPSEIPVAVTKVYLAVDSVQGAAADLLLQVIDDGVRPDPEISTRTCFRAVLARDSVRRGLPRRLNSLRLLGQV